MWTGLIWLKIGTGSGLCEHYNESSVFIKGGEFLGYLRALSDSQHGSYAMEFS
jgi:hypothetical protein